MPPGCEFYLDSDFDGMVDTSICTAMMLLLMAVDWPLFALGENAKVTRHGRFQSLKGCIKNQKPMSRIMYRVDRDFHC